MPQPGRAGVLELTSLLLINPNISARTTAMMLAVARPHVPIDVALHGLGAARGAAMIIDEAALAVAASEVMRLGLREGPGHDAIVVAAFGDPGVEALRACLTVPVVGIAEAAMAEAAACGRRFGIATTTPGLVGAIESRVRSLGFAGASTGIRLADGDPSALAADPDAQEEALATAVHRCLAEDGAEAVVIGGGPLSDTAARLRRRFGEVIVEPVPAAFRVVAGLLGAT